MYGTPTVQKEGKFAPSGPRSLSTFTHQKLKTHSPNFALLAPVHLAIPLHPLPYLLLSTFLSRHNQRALEVHKDPNHKNRCQVQFPEVFSTFPYKVTVTAVNALGRASAVITFEEASIGKRRCVVFCALLTSSNYKGPGVILDICNI